MPTPQSFKNHMRWDPPIHFFVFPVLILNFFFSIYIAIHHWPIHAHLLLWWIVVSAALVVLATKCRINDLKLQDRIIRLEEHLRLASILPADQLPHIPELATKQLIALRFASDEELPALVRKTLTQNFEPKAIKENITHWRDDNHRV
jgi:Family of unknown function (DUF6526)